MMKLLKTLSVLFILPLSTTIEARSAAVIIGPSGFQSNTFQQAQQMHIQTQQQLQAQDLYRRQLLMQDQQRQLQRILDQQSQIEFSNRSAIMHQYSDRLKTYSRQLNKSPHTLKKTGR